MNEASPRNQRISDEIRAKILKADPSVSNCELARVYGISDATVLTIRRKAGIRSTARCGAPKQKTALVAKPVKHKALARVAEPALKAVIRIEMSDEQMNRMWQAMSLGDKATAVGSVLMGKIG